MADAKDVPVEGASSASAPKADGVPKVDPKAAPKQNPVFKMMGMYNQFLEHEYIYSLYGDI